MVMVQNRITELRQDEQATASRADEGATTRHSSYSVRLCPPGLFPKSALAQLSFSDSRAEAMQQFELQEDSEDELTDDLPYGKGGQSTKSN